MKIDFKSEKASILFSVVIISSLLISLLASSLQFINFNQQSLESARHSNQARFLAKDLAINSFLSNQPFQRLSCPHKQASVARSNIKRTICGLFSPSDNLFLSNALIIGTELVDATYFPVIDFDKLLETAYSCPRGFGKLPTYTKNGFKLSLNSSVSQNTCSSISGTTFAALGNIELNTAINFSYTASTLTLSSLGFIDISATLKSYAPLVIIAAGDLHIKTLESYSAVTLVSSTASVQIDQIIGAPSLKIISWLKPALPLQPTGDNLLLPPIKNLEILSLS